ncbi:MAG TPA: M23 family metallopeptidase [Oligoflexia bacterium]|nr:M23 family metallopeptidase [Oligoflexia bacterium]HMR24694.1 M23 family metallopeptidase [Oligoflexia bacterium]
MLQIQCNTCQHSFEAPISKPGELSYQKCQNVFTMSYGIKLPCPKCKTILKLQRVSENSALGLAAAEEQSNTQEKTQLVSLDSLKAAVNDGLEPPKTKKVKIKVNVDPKKPLTDPKTAQIPEIISEKTKVKPFKILPQLLQKNQDFKLELKSNTSSKFSLNSNHLLSFAIGLCVLTLSLFVFSLFKEKPLQVEDQSIERRVSQKTVESSKLEKTNHADSLLDAPSIHDNPADSQETLSQDNTDAEQASAQQDINGQVADNSIGVPQSDAATPPDTQNNSSTEQTQSSEATTETASHSLEEDEEMMELDQSPSSASEPTSSNQEQSPIDISQDDKPENFQGGLEESMDVKDEVLSYETFQVDTQRYKKNLLHLPELNSLTSSYGVRLDPFTHKLAFHGGLDFKGKTGDPVKAALSGQVKFAGKKGRYGNVLIITHANGYESRYAHLSEISVKKGDAVNKGDVVAKVGSTGRSTGPHLHFELLKDNKKLDPLTVTLTLNE